MKKFEIGDIVVFDFEKAKRAKNDTLTWDRDLILIVEAVEDKSPMPQSNSLRFNTSQLSYYNYKTDSTCSNRPQHFRLATTKEIITLFLNKEYYNNNYKTIDIALKNAPELKSLYQFCIFIREELYK